MQHKSDFRDSIHRAGRLLDFQKKLKKKDAGEPAPPIKNCGIPCGNGQICE
jgi:hypothetical protein